MKEIISQKKAKTNNLVQDRRRAKTMQMVFNSLIIIAFAVLALGLVCKAMMGDWVMGKSETLRTVVLYVIQYYVAFSNILAIPTFDFLNRYFWNAPVVWWIGLIVMYIGLIGYILLFVQARNLKVGVDEKSEALKTDGIYKYSRNPIYLCFILFWLGGFLAFANLGILLILLGNIVFYALQVRLKEEPFLRKRYGEEYEKY